ncbi:DUF4365 domain-containing protein [Myxococcus xanthus]|uniref:DUF4365 domain-containing protein n=1 Tax=Myxococcus xanthus TaxID=34 RepID=A0A7Y4MT29_MYXXA|nr:DUF4365 domain-containing protein [Myxococcus xanthus]NOJ81165.1 DUF4365 domain-containing protein [Myxococcus xanthus]NOJ89419.1 DUF4365 domain-containing protein [Myxococcus xanthus]
MKQRTASRVTGNLGVDAVRNFCERYGFIFQAEPREDYGIDCYIEIATSSQPLNFIIGVQIKSGDSYFRGEDEHGFYVPVSEDDIAYWLASNIPVIFACYRSGDDELYLKHIQAYAADKAVQPSSIKRIEFNKIHDRAGPQLEAYLNNLVAATPSELDRLEVAAAQAPVFVTPSRRTTLVPGTFAQGHPEAPLKLDEIVRVADRTVILDPLGDGNSRVLGFSADSTWTLVLSVQHLGSMCLHQELKFINRILGQELSLPLWTKEDFEAGNELPLPDELGRRLEHAQHYVDKLEIVSGIEAHREYRHLESAGQPLLALEFGKICFNVDIRDANGRRALMLRTSTFRPAREAAILIERLSLGKMGPWAPSDEPEFFTQAKGFQSICEVTLHPRGDLVAFGVMTNAEHGCWGNNDVHHVFLAIKDLRELCVGAMRY